MKYNKLVSASKNVFLTLFATQTPPPMGVVCEITARNILTQLGGGRREQLGLQCVLQ